MSTVSSINEAIIQAKLNVCESIFTYINKLETIFEHSECDDMVDDIILESFEIFMESQNRSRDKIIEWMKDKGYWYDGKNPSKKKKCNRMFHFLKQHDFDPKSGTYKSDIKLKDGTNKRIKFNIDTHEELEITKKDREDIKRLVDQYGVMNDNGKKYLDFYEIPESEIIANAHLLQKIELNNSLKSGQNSFYVPIDDSIIMGSKELKGKQAIPQYTLKHEEGHAYDEHIKKNGTPGQKKTVRNMKQKYAGHIRSANSKMITVNPHDKNSMEGFADQYAMNNLKNRTKKGLRNFNNIDLKKAFNRIDKSVGEYCTTLEDFVEVLDIAIGTVDEYINKPWKNISNTPISYPVKDLVGRYQAMQESIQTLKDVSKSIGLGENEVLSDDKYKQIDSKINNELNTLRNKKSELEEDIQQIYDAFEDSFDNMVFAKVSTAGKTYDELDKMQKECHYAISGIRSEISKINEYRDIISNLKHESVNDTINKLKEVHNTKLVNLDNYKQDKFIKKPGAKIPLITISTADMERILKESNGDESKAALLVQKQAIPKLQKWKKELERVKKYLTTEFKKTQKMKDVSTEIRYRFAKKFIKEYFEELFDDYFFYG